MKYGTELIGKREIAEGTTEFNFRKPAGFEFKAGQAVDLTLIDPPETDAEGNTRTYSIASAPHEPYIAIATRMRDTAFKRTLAAAEPGLKVEIAGPTGSLTLHQNAERPAIFLAGGIGITPLHSMIKDAAKKALPHKIFLFYSNRRPQDAAYLEELRDIEDKHPNFTMIPTMTGEGSDWDWEGERGYISMEMIRRHIPDIGSALWYSAGPLEMVAAMVKMLNAAGISDDDIRTEEFAGY